MLSKRLSTFYATVSIPAYIKKRHIQLSQCVCVSGIIIIVDVLIQRLCKAKQYKCISQRKDQSQLNIDWLMFNNNLSSISAISWCEQSISINIHDKAFLHTSKLSVKQLGYICKYTNNSKNNRPIYSEFVRDLRQVGGFLRVLRFPSSIKLIATTELKYCWKWH
jgi:hypothetical protein